MDIRITPTKLRGTIRAIPSKSQAHRLLICSAFADRETTIYCPDINDDIAATAQCLNALGADIRRTADGYQVTPVRCLPKTAVLDCKESGSTLRFLLPIAGALGVDTTFQMAGRLPKRPLSPLWEEMEQKGCTLTRPTQDTIRCQGKLPGGEYTIDGRVSSQFITGLLFAMALIPDACYLTVTGKLESKPYIEMTQQALAIFNIDTTDFTVKENSAFRSPGMLEVEGDWSNAAFFLAAKQLNNDVSVTNLRQDSPQGDRAVATILPTLPQCPTICAADIPDLVPILAVTAGGISGATFTNIGRLRLKESDRVETTAAMLRNLGATVTVTDDTMCVHPGKYHSCTIDSAGDHRIAMAAAIAATVADGPVTILGAQCVSKSYPAFWEEYKNLGGQYEQYIR